MRSLQASPEGIKQAKTALVRRSLNQKALAEELGMTRQPVAKFFNGKRVDRNYFTQICERLGLDWEDIVVAISIIPSERDETNSDKKSEKEKETDNSLDEAVIGKKRVRVAASTLNKQMSDFLFAVDKMFEADRKTSYLQVEEVELTVEINAKGEVRLLGTRQETAKGGITIKFKPKQTREPGIR